MTQADFRQNLIPLLCIRPMRIFLSAESVRQARIVLLRATHLPFVALIWIYEASHRHVSRQKARAHEGNKRPASMESTTAAITSPFATEDPNVPRLRAPVPRIGGVEWNSEQTKAYTNEEVERLRAQVERVAAAVAYQQGKRAT